MSPRYASVVLDVDSTVSGVEGIDWLAERRGPDVAARIAALTDDAMRGTISLESIYGARLAEIRPTRADIDALSQAYVETIAAGCEDCVRRLQDAGIEVVLVSGGIRQAIRPLADRLGISRLEAVDIEFDARGVYATYDAKSPLATSAGKPVVVRALGLPTPVVAVGDGSTDLAMRGSVETFAAFTGFASRPSVVQGADLVVESFEKLLAIVLG